MIYFNLLISRHFNERLLERITFLEHNNLNQAQYNGQKALEINAPPSDFPNNLLE